MREKGKGTLVFRLYRAVLFDVELEKERPFLTLWLLRSSPFNALFDSIGELKQARREKGKGTLVFRLYRAVLFDVELDAFSPFLVLLQLHVIGRFLAGLLPKRR